MKAHSLIRVTPFILPFRTVVPPGTFLDQACIVNAWVPRDDTSASDVAVIAIRQLMLMSVRAHLRGEDPPGLDPTILYDQMNSASFTTPDDAPSQQVTPLPGGLSPSPAAAGEGGVRAPLPTSDNFEAPTMCPDLASPIAMGEGQDGKATTATSDPLVS